MIRRLVFALLMLWSCAAYAGDNAPYVAPDAAYLWAPPLREGQTPAPIVVQLSTDGQHWATVSIEPGTAQNYTAPLVLRNYDGAPFFKLEPGHRYGLRWNPGPVDGRGGWWEPAPLEVGR